MHTPLCRHAEGEPTEYAAQAAKLGLTEIGFTEHAPMPDDDFDDWRMLESELDLYHEKLDQAERDNPNVTIAGVWRLTTSPVTKNGSKAWLSAMIGIICSDQCITLEKIGVLIILISAKHGMGKT